MQPLSYILQQVGKIKLSDHKLLLPLPNDLVFVVDDRDELVKLGNLESGNGHEPHFIKTMMSFAEEGDVYVEVGANYGDFTLQMSRKLGENGRLYAIEPGKNTYQCLNQSVYLNEIRNIVTENYAVLDQEQEVNFSENVNGSLGSRITKDNDNIEKIQAITLDDYFKYRENKIDILRVDAEGSECKILRGAENIINSSPDIKIFIEWQPPLLGKYETKESLKECLSNLEQKGFIFLDSLGVNTQCDYKNYQVSIDQILKIRSLFEFVAIRSGVLKNNSENLDESCKVLTSGLLYDFAGNNDTKSLKKLIIELPNIDIDYFYPIGSTALYSSVQNEIFEVAQILLEAGANPNIASIFQVTPLYISVQDNNYPMVKLLLEYKADIELSLPSGSTPLFAAAYLGHDEILRLLIEHGANKNVSVGGMDAFHAALGMNHPSSAMILAGSTESFCQQIQSTEYEVKYAELCGDVKVEF